MRKGKTQVSEEAGGSFDKPGERIVRPHEQLQCWKDSVDLVECVYRETTGFPRSELYGLTSQIRRAVVSIPSNIAEGAARHSSAERKQFLFIARGSLSELETQVIIAKRLGYLSPDKAERLLGSCSRVGAMLNGLLRR